MSDDVAVVGVGYSDPGSFTDYRESSMAKEEQAHAAIDAALTDAGASFDDLDATMFTTVDGFEGTFRVERTLEVMGQANNIPVLSVNTGGTAGGSGVKAAYEYVASGMYDMVLVYGSPTFDSVFEGQQVMNTAAEPLYERHFITAIQMGALPSSAYMDAYGATEEDFAKTAARNLQNAELNPYAHRSSGKTTQEVLDSPLVSWPLRRLMTCPVSSGSGALVVASAEKAAELSSTPIWIDAIDSISNTFATAYRTYESFPKLKMLADRVYEEAGIDDPREELDVAETFNPYIPFELMQYEALRICDEGEGKHMVRDGVTARGGDVPFNPSGGVVSTNSGICASLSRHIEVVLQLRGDAGKRQVESPEQGISHSWGANLGQFHQLAVFSR
ncbi:thiolase family protein [Haloarchaeobius sp. DFWS5]|uniref:thiolase family protein n=1 Tax=Haloarchaeobius sp. DFWS5 TaxID=3446114 RepID=UPI003EB729E8